MVRRAFSLIELALVLAIVAVIAAIAMPRYGAALARQRLDAAARRIAADLEYARLLARTSSVSRVVRFNVPTNSYQLPGTPDPNRPSITYTVDLSREPYRARLLALDFGGTDQVTFDVYGRPDKGGTVSIQCGDLWKTISVDAATGLVVIR